MEVVKSNVLIEIIKTEKVSGEFVDIDKKSKREGKIIALGEDLKNHPTLKKGVLIKYREHNGGEEFKVKDKSFIVIDYEFILIVY